MVWSPAKAHPTAADRKRVRQEIPTYTEEGCKRVRQNMEFPEARQMRFDDEAAAPPAEEAAAQEVVAKVPSRAACRQEEGRRVIDRSASQMVHASTAAAQEVVAKVPSRAACRQEEGRRFIDPEREALLDADRRKREAREEEEQTEEQKKEGRRDAARRGRAMRSDSRRKEQRSELVQKKRLEIAEALMLMHAAEPRACAFPLLELPEELHLLVAGHVVSPRDRAALCVAVPPLGRKAIKEIPTYTGPLMSLGKRVLSGGAVDEAEVRRYVREFAPSEAEHPSLALNECAQLNAMAAPSARVRCVVQGSNLEWRLESGALLRCWKPFERTRIHFDNAGNPGMHHYEGAAGAERLVSVAFADGAMRDFRGERGAEVMWQ